MQRTLREIFLAKKHLAQTPVWRAEGRSFALSVPLEVDEITIEGLQLRGKARPNAPDSDVMLQLQIHPAGRRAIHLDRVCWKPRHAHNNGPDGPKEWRFREFHCSHRHHFDLNWKVQLDEMESGNLPIAVPLEHDPERFEDLLALIDSWFRIN